MQSSAPKLVTLKKRRDFLRLRGGARWSTAAFVLETRPRSSPSDGERASPSAVTDASPPRFGFTVTRQLGSAVVRNRIRRRLKAAVRELAAGHARAGHDYVLIARAAALEQPFAELKKELEAALHRVHHAPQRRSKPRR